MPDFSRILSASTPLTLASVTRGSQPLVMADLARAAAKAGRAVFVADNEAAMSAIASAAQFFAPELQVIEFPAWDCLPYDRSSPALSVSARRLAALHALQLKRQGPQLLVTTTNALLQRVLTPFRIRESVRLLKPGMEVGHESLIALLRRQGYHRADTAIDAGEFAVRGSIFDIVPSGLESGEGSAGLRLDFFGDELETLRLFDTGTQRSTGTTPEHLLLPASEALVDDETVKRFRTRYREMFGANATADPLYQAVSDGRRLAGMEHWLPLFEDRLVTLFDHLGPEDVIVVDSAALGAIDERLTDIADYHKARLDTSGQKAGSYRPLPADALYLGKEEIDGLVAAHPVHRADPFAQPESAKVIDFGFGNARDFAPERARGDNAYEAAARHLQAISKSGRKAILAAYSTGSRARIASILGEAHGPEPRLADACRKPWALRCRAAPPRWCSRSKPASPAMRSRSSPSRTSWATAWSGGRKRRRIPTPSSPNWRR